MMGDAVWEKIAPAHIDVRGKAQWTYVRVC